MMTPVCARIFDIRWNADFDAILDIWHTLIENERSLESAYIEVQPDFHDDEASLS